MQLLKNSNIYYWYKQYIRVFEFDLDRLRDSVSAVRKDVVTLIMYTVINNSYFIVVCMFNWEDFSKQYILLKDSIRVQCEEKQNNNEIKLSELRTELEKVKKKKKKKFNLMIMMMKKKIKVLMMKMKWKLIIK